MAEQVFLFREKYKNRVSVAKLTNNGVKKWFMLI